MLNRYKLIVEYDGTHYHGMQRQNDLPTIQQALENAIEKYCGQNQIYYCGRTDVGVHAIGQVVHFVETLKLNPSKCIFVGDRKTDETTAIRMGMKFITAEDFWKLKI